MNRIRACVLMLCLFSFFLKPAGADGDIFNFVSDVIDHQDGITFAGVKVSAYWIGPEAVLQTVRIFREPGRWRFEYFPFKNHLFQESILDRGELYQIKPSKHLIFRLPFDSKDYESESILGLAANNYDWIDEGERIWGGISTRQIAAVSHADGKTAARFWIDPAHRITLADAWYDDEGMPVFASYYAQIDFPKRLPDSYFAIPWWTIRDFPVPKEMEGTAAMKDLDFKPVLPTFLPEGFKRIGVGLTQWPTHRKLNFRYSDGLRDISIYENLRKGMYHRLNGSTTINSNGDILELSEEPNGKIVRFADGKLTIAVEGNLSEQTLVKVALSIAKPVAPDTLQNQSLRVRLSHYFLRGLHAIMRRL